MLIDRDDRTELTFQSTLVDSIGCSLSPQQQSLDRMTSRSSASFPQSLPHSTGVVATASLPEPSGHAGQPRRRKSKGKQSAQKKPRKQKVGWGPYRTVVKERAVVFNLTLDVQQLQQEVHSLTVARNILLEARAVNQRHAPSGSLMRTVEKYYDLLRTGFNIEPVDAARRHVHSAREQCEFLRSIMDPTIDCGGGLFGVDVMIEQIRRYSIFLRFIRLQLHSSNIVNAEGSVVITTKGTLHFQILRDTIAGIFPHIIGQEWLVSKLVGREVVPAVSLTFYFDARDKVCKYVIDLDFFQTFAELLADPEDVNILLGRALIGANSMLGEDVPRKEEVSAVVELSREKAGGPRSRQSMSVSRNITKETSGSHRRQPKHASAAIQPNSSPTREPTLRIETQAVRGLPEPGPPLAPGHFNQVIWRYFGAFSQADGNDEDSAALSDEQRVFVNECVSPVCEFGDADSGCQLGPKALEERWCSLKSAFELLVFVQTSQKPLVFHRDESLCFVRSTAQYVMRITSQTIRRVFPHVVTEELLLDALLGAVITVRSQLKFWVDSDSGRIACVKEEMDFRSALGKFVGNRDDLDWVMTGALLTRDGVRFQYAAPSSGDIGADGSSLLAEGGGEFQRLLTSELTSEDVASGSLIALPPGA